MTSKDLKVKLRPKHKITLPITFHTTFFLAMSNIYFILKNSMSENNFKFLQ
jgi:hypothetical protein